MRCKRSEEKRRRAQGARVCSDSDDDDDDDDDDEEEEMRGEEEEEGALRGVDELELAAGGSEGRVGLVAIKSRLALVSCPCCTSSKRARAPRRAGEPAGGEAGDGGGLCLLREGSPSPSGRVDRFLPPLLPLGRLMVVVVVVVVVVVIGG
jgi:hypothetical protein